MKNLSQILIIIVILSLFSILNYKMLVKKDVAFTEKSKELKSCEFKLDVTSGDLRSANDFTDKRCVCLMYDQAGEDFDRTVSKQEICSYKPNAGVFHPERGWSLLTK